MKIYFDMDGTIADLYGVKNWLQYLIEGNCYPYVAAKPLCNMNKLENLLIRLQKRGHEIHIISWLSKESDIAFDKKVTEAKYFWLKKYLPNMTFNQIFIVPYGTPKYLFGDGILFDDEENNRNEWKGRAYSEKEIFEVLSYLI